MGNCFTNVRSTLRYSERVFEKRAQVAHRPQLDCEPQPIVRTTLLSDQRMVGVIQVEIPARSWGDGGPA